ncbi:hypothetical protein GCM10020254_14480 [Streptomyces goshikiensis]
MVFTPTWEKVVSPLVDWLSARPDVDQDRIALTGLSMAGDLAPRAAAFESRIAALVAMPGCVEPWLGFPPEIREILTPSKEETNDIWNTKVVPELPPEAAAVLKKRFEPFSIPAMLQARQGKLFTDFYTPATRIQALSIASVVSRIKAPTLVLDYEDEQFYPGQPRQLYDALTSPKDYLKLTAAQGAQLHCSPMAPQLHCEVVFDWLQETLPGGGSRAECVRGALLPVGDRQRAVVVDARRRQRRDGGRAAVAVGRPALEGDREPVSGHPALAAAVGRRQQGPGVAGPAGCEGDHGLGLGVLPRGRRPLHLVEAEHGVVREVAVLLAGVLHRDQHVVERTGDRLDGDGGVGPVAGDAVALGGGGRRSPSRRRRSPSPRRTSWRNRSSWPIRRPIRSRPPGWPSPREWRRRSPRRSRLPRPRRPLPSWHAVRARAARASAAAPPSRRAARGRVAREVLVAGVLRKADMAEDPSCDVAAADGRDRSP